MQPREPGGQLAPFADQASTSGERLSDARPVGQCVFMAGHELDGELRVARAAQRLDALLDLGLGCRERGGADQFGADEAPLLGLHEHQVPAMILQIVRIPRLEVARQVHITLHLGPGGGHHGYAWRQPGKRLIGRAMQHDRRARTRLGHGTLGVRAFTSTTDVNYRVTKRLGLFGGYQFNRNFALEAGYFNLGTFGFSANTVPLGAFSGQVKIQGFNLDLVATLPLSERFSVFARAGAQAAKTGDTYSGNRPVSSFNPSPSKREVNYKAGVGLQYEVNPSFLIRAEAERYRISDTAGKKGNADMVSVSLVFPFGRSQAAAPRPMAEPVYVPPAPAPMPPPVYVAPPPVVVAPPPPAPAPAPMPAPVERRRVSFSAESLFAFDKTDIKPEGKAALDRFSNDLRGTQFDRVNVEGHADRLGSDSYNMRLSARRAESVKTYLISSGAVSANKISAAGKGETMPVTKPGDCRGTKQTPALVACLQPDRRVDVEVTGTK